jgi:GntR family transcriptional regulator
MPIKFDRQISVPAYVQVASQLRSRILSGEIDGRLPPEADLVRESRLSRITVRKGLEILEQEGLVERKQGLGTFVRRTINQELSRAQTITDVLLNQGIVPKVRCLSFGLVIPPEKVRRALRLNEKDKLLLTKRLYFNGNDPVALLHIFLPTSLRKHAEILRRSKYATETSYTLWERLGVVVAGATHVIHAGKADAEDSKALAIGKGDPILILDRVSYGTDGAPLEYVKFHYHWQRFEFSVNAPRISSQTDQDA